VALINYNEKVAAMEVSKQQQFQVHGSHAVYDVVKIIYKRQNFLKSDHDENSSTSP